MNQYWNNHHHGDFYQSSTHGLHTLFSPWIEFFFNWWGWFNVMLQPLDEELGTRKKVWLMFLYGTGRCKHSILYIESVENVFSVFWGQNWLETSSHFFLLESAFPNAIGGPTSLVQIFPPNMSHEGFFCGNLKPVATNDYSGLEQYVHLCPIRSV
jgi:hypothetical protein